MSQLTLLATTDVHGNALNWDYYRDRPWQPPDGEELGLAQAATIIQRIRAERGPERVLLVDNGDTLQGTPLATFYARQEPITDTGVRHPLAAAFNAMGYDACNIGNHEFNYGLNLLQVFEEQLEMPLLGANILDPHSRKPLFQPFTLVRRVIDGRELIVGIVGLTTPGSMVWDRAHLEGQADIIDMVASAAYWVPQVRELGADVVVVLSHAGLGQTTYATTVEAPSENPAREIAQQVPGIDVMVIGHTHRDAPEQWITCESTGQSVLLTQPRALAAGLTETTIDVEPNGEGWSVSVQGAIPLPVAGQEPLTQVVDAVTQAHEKTRSYVNQQVAVSERELSTAESCWRATGAIEFIQQVQAATVAEALADGEYAGLPVVSLTAPTSRTAAIPEGTVSIRDLAGIYVFDNTLAAVLLTGAQLRAHLEHAARYYADLPPGVAFDPATMTGAERDGLTVWDYQYDIAWGVSYEIDLTRPVGHRIRNLSHPDGSPVRDDERFAVALNHYRRSGAGDYPDVSTAPVLYNDMVEIRQLLIDWALERGVAVPGTENWRIVTK
jgi:2'''',3''''-cyclic-nucleotide 2''''-phosphodiesterase